MIIQRLATALRRQDWFQVVIEILIVIIGIFLGLQVQEFYERGAEREREQIYLERIYEDLESDIFELGESISRQEFFQEMGAFLTETIENPDLVRERPTYFILAVDMASYSSYPALASDSYEEINLNADRSIFRDQELLREITSYYTETTGGSLNRGSGISPIQQNYFLLSDGILTFDQMREINLKGPGAEFSFSVEDAEAAYSRMIARPDFIDQIPRATSKGFVLRTYYLWQENANNLRQKVGTALGKEDSA